MIALGARTVVVLVRLLLESTLAVVLLNIVNLSLLDVLGRMMAVSLLLLVVTRVILRTSTAFPLIRLSKHGRVLLAGPLLGHLIIRQLMGLSLVLARATPAFLLRPTGLVAGLACIARVFWFDAC